MTNEFCQYYSIITQILKPKYDIYDSIMFLGVSRIFKFTHRFVGCDQFDLGLEELFLFGLLYF